MKRAGKFMSAKHRQTIYILLAFLILAVIHFIGAIMNMFIQNDLLAHIINSSGLVINGTGVAIGIYNIYQGLTLRKHSSLWAFIFIVGIICVWFNAYALAL
jgi:hypothetical protein